MPALETLSSWASKCLKSQGSLEDSRTGGLERPRHPSSRSTPFTRTPARVLTACIATDVGCRAWLLVVWLPHRKLSSLRANVDLLLLYPQLIEKDLAHRLDEQRTWREYFDQRLTSPCATEICWPGSEGRKETPGGVCAPSSQASAAAGVSKRLGDSAAWRPAEWTASPQCGTERAEATRPESTWARAMVASQRRPQRPRAPERWAGPTKTQRLVPAVCRRALQTAALACDSCTRCGAGLYSSHLTCL